MTTADWPEVERIYGEGIDDGSATFETSPPTWESFDTGRLELGRLVAVDGGGAVLGWAAVSPVSTREVYRGVVEHSVYVARSARGAGIGRDLLSALIAETESAGIWMIQASVFADNVASLRLHEAQGFRTVGHRERIARSARGPFAGQWRNTILIERRSGVVGMD
ncbi:GNAT family N-acetyltransferase [Microbacterium koreense]|uniref:GNAT family N-acetyltransferase n=1 Tax=Microbacterium koreense TaxID=323761 RepID=A0ABW2ZQT6_9MICO